MEINLLLVSQTSADGWKIHGACIPRLPAADQAWQVTALAASEPRPAFSQDQQMLGLCMQNSPRLDISDQVHSLHGMVSRDRWGNVATCASSDDNGLAFMSRQ